MQRERESRKYGDKMNNRKMKRKEENAKGKNTYREKKKDKKRKREKASVAVGTFRGASSRVRMSEVQPVTSVKSESFLRVRYRRANHRLIYTNDEMVFGNLWRLLYGAQHGFIGA